MHSERDEELRFLWQSKLTEFRADQLVYVDESASNERTKDRKMGWTTKGMPCRVRMSGKRSKRWSILPAIGMNGYLDYEIYHGGFNGERFCNFIRSLLPKMNPYPGPRSVLVMDNASTHHSIELTTMCKEAGVLLEYLPPYSPDFNPIEESFSALKAWMKRNRDLASDFEDYFEGFLHLAILQCSVKRSAKGYFRSAGVDVTEEDFDVDYDTLDSEI